MNLYDEAPAAVQAPAVAELEPPAQPGAHVALMLLLAINLFNYIDRQVLAAVLPKIKESFLQNDPYANTKLGYLTTAFLVAYMLIAPLFGWLGDRMSRWFLIAVGVILWSLASGASGLANPAGMVWGMAAGYWILLATRCFVGVGEAAYGPVAPTLISDLFPVRRRGKMLAYFYVAIPVGGALGYVLGGLVDKELGWPWAFYLVVPPGILLGLLCLFMREPARGQADPHAAITKKALSWKDYTILFKTPSYVLNTLGMTAMTFAVGGIAVWMPTYIYERESKCLITKQIVDQLHTSAQVPNDVIAKFASFQTKDPLPLARFQKDIRHVLSEEEWQQYGDKLQSACCAPSLGEINTWFGMIVVVSGLIATLFGGWAGDALRSRFSGSYFLVSGVSMMFGFPMVLLVLWAPFPLAWVFVFWAVFFLFLNTGPTNAILANVTHPSIRSTGFALNILVIHVLGDAISPVIMGYIADKSSMDLALGVVAAVVLLGGGFWLWGAVYLERDTELASRRIGSVEREVPHGGV